MKGCFYNHNNWIDLDQVLREVLHKSATESYRTQLSIKSLDLSVCDSPVIKNHQDSLYITLFESHFVPMLYLASKDHCLVCESQNLFDKNPGFDQRLEMILGKRLKPLMSTKVLRADQCGAGAIALSLELLRLYKVGDLEVSSVSPPRGVLENLVQRLHPFKSEPTVERKNVNEKLVWFVCKVCGVYRKLDKRTVLSHERRCNLK